MSTGTFSHPRVLVADHEEAICVLLKQILQLEHYRTDTAMTLEEAYEKVDDELYDVVLTDLFCAFPPQLVAAQGLQRRCYPTPVGILSGWPIEPAEAARGGFAFVLQKPFDIDLLLERITSHLTPLLTPLEQEQAGHIKAYLQALNSRHWGMLSALLAPEVGYIPLTRSLFATARAIFGQEAVLAHVQRVLTRLPDFRIDHSILLSHPQQLMTRFRSSWQGRDGQRQRITGMIFFRFRGERISQIGFSMNTRRLREMLGPISTK